MSGSEQSDVVIVGAGPAGMVAALLLAKAGYQVTVLEKNGDFHREFRGEVLQPRFLHAMEQVGLRDLVLGLPHQKFEDFRVFVSGRQRAQFPMQNIDSRYPYVIWMTQPTLLSGLHQEASTYSHYQIKFNAAVKSLEPSEKDCRVVYEQEGNEREIKCQVAIGSDGRFSHMRRLLGAELVKEVHDFDVMWFEMDRPEAYTHGADFFVAQGMNCLVLPKYPDKIQTGILIAPGTLRQHLKKGPQKIANELKKVHPMFRGFADQLIDFKSFTILAAKIERVTEWAGHRSILIGDAAHTCSPVFAIGVTIAVETAIVAADVLIDCFEREDFSYKSLQRIQDRREAEVKAIQRAQEWAWHGLKLGRRSLPFLGVAIRLGVSSGLAPVNASRFVSRREPLPLERL